MKNVVLAAAAMFLLVGTSRAQQVEDPHGWTKAKWGMTEEDIKKLFSDAAILVPKTKAEAPLLDAPKGFKFLGIRNFEIIPLAYTVRFVFDKGGLNSVTLWPEGDKAVVCDVAQSQLLWMLKDKYGTPQSSNEDMRDPPGKDRRWEWTLPDTAIKLSFGDYRDTKFNFVFLTY